MARELLTRAAELGVEPWGVSFHVGSQQKDPAAWEAALAEAAGLFRDLEAVGIELGMVNLGGGFPTPYRTRGARRRGLRRRDHGGGAAPFRQPHPVPDRRARPRPGRQCRRDPDRGRADRREGRRRRRGPGSISTSASSAASPRPMDEAIQYPIVSAAPGDADAGDPGRPDLRQRRRALRAQRRTACPRTWRSATGSRSASTGAYTTTYAAVGVQRLRAVARLLHLSHRASGDTAMNLSTLPVAAAGGVPGASTSGRSRPRPAICPRWRRSTPSRSRPGSAASRTRCPTRPSSAAASPRSATAGLPAFVAARRCRPGAGLLLGAPVPAARGLRVDGRGFDPCRRATRAGTASAAPCSRR